MTRDIDAEHLLLTGELLLHRPVGQLGQRVFQLFLFLGETEEPVLATIAITRGSHAGLESTIQSFRQLRSVAAS